jgi:hypothetical protein
MLRCRCYATVAPFGSRETLILPLAGSAPSTEQGKLTSGAQLLRCTSLAVTRSAALTASSELVTTAAEHRALLSSLTTAAPRFRQRVISSSAEGPVLLTVALATPRSGQKNRCGQLDLALASRLGLRTRTRRRIHASDARWCHAAARRDRFREMWAARGGLAGHRSPIKSVSDQQNKGAYPRVVTSQLITRREIWDVGG